MSSVARGAACEDVMLTFSTWHFLPRRACRTVKEEMDELTTGTHRALARSERRGGARCSPVSARPWGGRAPAEGDSAASFAFFLASR